MNENSPVSGLSACAPETAPPQEAPEVSRPHSMLPPQRAWLTLCRRTGGHVSRATFYRWLQNGKVYSIRLGYHIFVPRDSVEKLIQRCLEGERL